MNKKTVAGSGITASMACTPKSSAYPLFHRPSLRLFFCSFIVHPGKLINHYFTRDEKKQIEEGSEPEDWKPAKRSQKDLDATWTKKHGKSHYGYKLSVNVDKKHKIIRDIETGTASTHDGDHFEEVIDPANTSKDVYADRGYPSKEREAWLKAKGYRNRIQRKGQRNKPLSEAQKRRNRTIAKTRVRVEHVFASIAQMGGKSIRTIDQERANFGMTLMAACYNIKRLAYFHHAGIKAF